MKIWEILGLSVLHKMRKLVLKRTLKAVQPFDTDHGTITYGLNQLSQQRPDTEKGPRQQKHCRCALKGTEKTRWSEDGCWTSWILQETMELFGRGCVCYPSRTGKKDPTGDFTDG